MQSGEAYLIKMDKQQIIDKIRKTQIMPVIRAASEGAAREVIESVLARGINVLEITLTTPGAIGLISEYSKKYADRVLVGAGTVVDTENARKCFDAGAKFIVSPVFHGGTVEFCNQNEIVIMPGALTPTEIFEASNRGADAVKVFPVSAMGGAAYLRAIKSVFPEIELVPTGGVSPENFNEYLDAGAIAVGIGSGLT